jgi:putative methionine-R-sulfoxide reductase with GAF domain
MKHISTDTDTSIDRLKEISTWVSSVQDLDQLLELIIESATRMMDAKASSLLLLDPRTKKLYFKVATGERGTDVKQFEIDLGQGIAGHVAQTGEPLLIPDVAHEPRWYKEISESIGFQTRSIACVPMKLNGDIIGVVEIIDKADGSTIHEEDLKILSVFADLAAQAIGNARKIEHNKKEIRDLKQELQEKYPTLTTLSEIMSEKITSDRTSGQSQEVRQNMLASLNPYIKGAYSAMFNGQTNWDYGFHTVLDISALPEAVKKPTYDILLKDTWQFCKYDKRKTKRLYVDEAHQFADPDNPQTLKFLSTCIKRGRKYGISFVTATQNLPDFLSIERYGQAILDNSYFKLFFRLGETDIPVVKKLYNFSEPELKILRGSSSWETPWKSSKAGLQNVE